MLGMTDILKTDAVEAEFLTGTADIHAAARILAALGPREIVLTHKDGLLVLADGKLPRGGLPPGELRGRSGRGDTCVGSYASRAARRRPGRGDALGRGAHEPEARSRRPDPAQPRGRRARCSRNAIDAACAALACLLSSPAALRTPAPQRDRRVPRLRRQRLSLRLSRSRRRARTATTLRGIRRGGTARLARGQAAARGIRAAAGLPRAGDRHLCRGERPGRRRQRDARLLRGAGRLRVRRHARRQHLPGRRDGGRRRARRRRALPQDPL